MFQNVSEHELYRQRILCESMLSHPFVPSRNLKRDIESHLANVNREIGKRIRKRVGSNNGQ